MKYTLITRNGKVLTFNIFAAAKQFQLAYGGVVFSSQILDQLQTVDQ